MMPAANSIASIIAFHGAWTDKSLVNVNVRSFDEAQLASIAASADDIARLARKGVRAGGDGLSPIRELFNCYGPMDYDPEAIAAVAGVHIDLVRAMARLGYLNVFKGRVVSVCA